MANGKHISQDEIQYIVDVESSKAQQEIHKLEKASASLRAENKERPHREVQAQEPRPLQPRGVGRALPRDLPGASLRLHQRSAPRHQKNARELI